LIARASGLLMVFSMPSMTLEEKYNIPPKSQLIEINSDGSRAFIIDNSNVLRLLQLEKKSTVIPTDQTARFKELEYVIKLDWLINLDNSWTVLPRGIQGRMGGEMVVAIYYSNS
jgi:hypothetical protein